MRLGARLVVLLVGVVCLGISAAWPSPRLLGKYTITYYHVAVEDDRYAGLEADEILLDVDDCEVARVSPAYRRRLDLEGTGRLADGRTVNVAERRPDGWRYQDLGHGHWGLGAAGQPLVPFRSVAADPRRLPRGSQIFLPTFAGEAFGGTLHGGYFVVDDVGSWIRGSRLDIFIGDESHLARVESVVPSHHAADVYLVETSHLPGAPVDLLRP